MFGLISVRRRIKSLLRWFVPGLGVKRWFFLLLTGITLLGFGIAIFFSEIYRTAPDTWWLPALTFISLQSFAAAITCHHFCVNRSESGRFGDLGSQPVTARAVPQARKAIGGSGFGFPAP